MQITRWKSETFFRYQTYIGIYVILPLGTLPLCAFLQLYGNEILHFQVQSIFYLFMTIASLAAKIFIWIYWWKFSKEKQNESLG